jgi:hypothetical protein
VRRQSRRQRNRARGDGMTEQSTLDWAVLFALFITFA